jgi:hypothetical protein
MEPIKQTTFGSQHGNCWAACIASVLELRLDELPDISPADDNVNWWDDWVGWFKTEGIQFFYMDFAGDTPWIMTEGTHVILSGKSPRAKAEGKNFLHCIVARYELSNGKHYFRFVHDPYPDSGPPSQWFVGDPENMLMLWRNNANL